MGCNSSCDLGFLPNSTMACTLSCGLAYDPSSTFYPPGGGGGARSVQYECGPQYKTEDDSVTFPTCNICGPEIGCSTGKTCNIGAGERGGFCVSVAGGGGGGDPHFVSFDGTPFSFRSGCDIDLVESAAACEGAGLRIVIRTTVETSISAEFSDIGSNYISSPAFSYISSVVVQIGQEEVLEFDGDSSCHLNGELVVEAVEGVLEQVAASTNQDDAKDVKIEHEHDEDEVPAVAVEVAAGFVEDARHHADTDPVHTLLAGYPVTKGFKGKRGKIVSYELRLDDNRVVHVRARAGILSIDVSGKFDDAKGLLGTSGKEGLLVSRDGHDMTTDWLALGESWQVQSTQPMLFREARFPQHPQQCTYDAAAAGGATAKHGRRLRGIIEAEPVDAEAAAAACAGLTGTMHEWCLSDVLSMGLGMAEDSFFQTYN